MKNCSAMIRAFCGEMEKAGYWCGVYCSTSAIRSYIDSDTQKRYSMWVAEWGSRCNYTGEIGMWQYSEKGRIIGIAENVDLDECYVDYPTGIKAAGKNGYPKPVEAPSKPTEKPVKDTVKVTMEINGKPYSGVLESL